MDTTASHVHTIITELIAKEYNPTLIVGLSGGPDSVFLFHMLRMLHEQKKLTLIAAHLDHGWRKDSALDADFCKNLCKTYTIPFVYEHAKNLEDTYKKEGSLEEQGRNMRRAFFEQVRKSYNGHAILLGHHLNDQQETFFLRLLRGTSLEGLTCMKIKSGFYMRPLLSIPKEKILAYLNQNNLSYRIDSSNKSPLFLRNRIREKVMPALEACDKRFNQKFTSTLAHLAEANDFIARLAHKAFEAVFSLSSEGSYTGDLVRFRELDPVLQKRILYLWLIKEKIQFKPSFDHLEEILRFLLSKRGGKHQITQTLLLIKKGNRCSLIKR